MLQKRYLCHTIFHLEALEFHHGVVESEGPAAPAPGQPPPLLGLALPLLVTSGLGAGLSAEAAVTTRVSLCVTLSIEKILT